MDVRELMRQAREKNRKPFPESEWKFHKTKDEARATLAHEYGDLDCLKRMSGGCSSVGVEEAIRILDGEVQAGWGITRWPTEWQ